MTPVNRINNAFYDELGERWYEDDTHPIALLRVESQTKLAYIRAMLAERNLTARLRVLDVACGAGFIALPLAEDGHQLIGIDQSPNSLAAATRRATAKRLTAEFLVADALALPHSDESFDVVLMMDCLEHFSDYRQSLSEAKRVLRPGGLLFYHTFNRNFLSYIIACKAIGWFAKDAPEHIHVYDLLIKPQELEHEMASRSLRIEDERGLVIDLFSAGLFKALWQKRINDGVRFKLSSSKAVGYIGLARKEI